MARDASIFACGAVLVPDFVTPAEEARILLRIAEAPWLPELSRRVQHYGFRYDYRGSSRPVPAAPFPRWATVMAERLRPHFAGALPVQCIVNEYRPGHPRKALGRIYGLAVRFGRPADGASLLVGEGIETVLSLVTAVPEVTAAAALTAGSLGAFAPPLGLTRLVIARDNDAEGERAAERLARRCARAGVAALVLVPQGGDFNDDLVALGPHALAARVGPLLVR